MNNKDTFGQTICRVIGFMLGFVIVYVSLGFLIMLGCNMVLTAFCTYRVTYKAAMILTGGLIDFAVAFKIIGFCFKKCKE